MGTGLRFRVSMTRVDRGLIGRDVDILAWQIMIMIIRPLSFSCMLNTERFSIRI